MASAPFQMAAQTGQESVWAWPAPMQAGEQAG